MRLHVLFVLLVAAASSIGMAASSPAVSVMDVSAEFAVIVSNRAVPGLMGRRLEDGVLVAAGIAGVRVRGQNTNALLAEDVMHYGSMFKVQTATLGGILVDTNVLTWDVYLLDYVTASQKSAFVASDARWTNVTLRQLLSMSSGIVDADVPVDLEACYAYNTDPPAGRQYLADALSHMPLATKPGVAYSYSNSGYSMAGLILEIAWQRFSGQTTTYEQLMQQKLFGPLGVTSFTLGPPGISSTFATNLPAANPSPVAIGHNLATNAPADGYALGAPVGRGYIDADNPLLIAPAGTWAASMADYTKLLMVQMQTNQTALLTSLGLTISTLIDIRTPLTPLPFTNGFSFSLGWMVDNATTNHLLYNGSNSRWVSIVDARLDSQVALIAACNQGGDATVQDALAVLQAVPEPGLMGLLLGIAAGCLRGPRARMRGRQTRQE